MAEELLTEMANRISEIKSDLKDTQTNIYILSGVLGGVDLILIIALIALIVIVVQARKKLEDAKLEKKIQEEIEAQKFVAYTGEEVHRRMMAAANPAVPLGQTGTKGQEGEYAFNSSFVDDRILSPQPGPSTGAPPKLNRY